MNKWRAWQWAVVGVTLLGAALRLYQLGAKSFWWDECFTFLLTVRLPWNAAWQAMIEDANKPPLYYLMLRAWLLLVGGLEYTLRFPSAAFGLLGIPALYQLGRRLKGNAVGLVAALLLAVNPFHIWQSQDGRMYAPMLFFAVLAMDRFVRLLRDKPGWVWFILFSALAYLMHYAAVILVYVQLVCLLPCLRQTSLVRRWFLAQALALAPLLPWVILVYIVNRLGPTGLGWIPQPGPLAPLVTLWDFTTADVQTATALVLALALAVAVVLASGLLPWDDNRRVLVWWLALPIAFLFVVSIRRSFYVDRYLSVGLPAFLLILALGILARQELTWRLTALAVVLAAMVWGTARLYSDPYFFKEDWRSATAAVDAGLAPGDGVVLQDTETMVGTTVYRRQEWPRVVLEPDREAVLLDGAAAQYKRIWLVWRSPLESNHRVSKSEPFDVFVQATPPVRAWLAAHRDKVTLDLRLPGLSVLRLDSGT